MISSGTMRAYALPLVVFTYAVILIPNTLPDPSYYDVLKIKRNSSIQMVQEAYSTQWSLMNSDVEVDIREFIKIRYAYELLTNPIWKRDYDIYDIDEQLHVVETASKRYAGKKTSQLEFPLLHPPSGSIDHHSSKVITGSDFWSIFPDSNPWIIQLYSSGSNHCAEFSKTWNKIASLLDGVANIGVVELGEKELAVYLADKRSTGKPFFRNGIPSLVAIRPRCSTTKCFTRFDGELTVDKVINWFATTVLTLPQINYYSKESLTPDLLGEVSHHKVKVIFFSKTEEDATPFIRQAAKDYWAYTSFAFILWREEESSYWWGAFGVQSAPCIVFVKDPGVEPVVHHGSMNNSFFLNMLENNKQQELKQLRSVTSMELGCDPRGYSRAGYDSTIWYCVIVVGRPSWELSKMRETMCRVQKTLSKQGEAGVKSDNQSLAPAVDAFQRKRLTFAWLDGEKEKKYCRFYLGVIDTHHTCGGEWKGLADIPRIFVVRYLKNSSADSDLACQFVAKYSGEVDVPQITEWLAYVVKDGDSKDSSELPFFTLRTPELAADDTEPVWSETSLMVLLKDLQQSIGGALSGLFEDPRISAALFAFSLISFGIIWLQRSQQVQPSQPSQPSSKAPSNALRNQRLRVRARSNKNRN